LLFCLFWSCHISFVGCLFKSASASAKVELLDERISKEQNHSVSAVRFDAAQDVMPDEKRETAVIFAFKG